MKIKIHKVFYDTKRDNKILRMIVATNSNDTEKLLWLWLHDIMGVDSIYEDIEYGKNKNPFGASFLINFRMRVNELYDMNQWE